MLYDETPITGEWLEACGGEWNGDEYIFQDCFALAMECGEEWTLTQMAGDRRGSNVARNRGEFRRAAELLGISLKDV